MTKPPSRGLQRVRATLTFRHDGRIVNEGDVLLLHATQAAELLRQGLVQECRTDEAALLVRWPNLAMRERER